MPLEILIYQRGIDQVVGKEVVLPGEKAHVLDSVYRRRDKIQDRIHEIYCRTDDELSTVHIIYPSVINLDPEHPRAIFDRNKTENRPKIIKRGEEIELKVKQRIVGVKRGRRKFDYWTLRLTQR